MSPRSYRLGRREEAVRRTRTAILTAARDLLASRGTSGLSAGAVARKAGVSRITVYNQFGSLAGMLREVAAGARRERQILPATEPADPQEELRRRIAHACSMWAADPALFRGLPAEATAEFETAGDDRVLAEQLAASGHLRPGCSLREAEDVIGAVTSFQVFDRLHKDGRRTTSAVGEILMRMARAILASA
ncbi:MAG TPA: helix-turn-helix domain-containing protein [Gemmatimonadales bacterium]|nr:helix-turn-helix domain-containing protein [Gemmatimonadales bacterium]